MYSKTVEVKKARNGLGLFSKKSFNKEKIILQIKGKLVHESKFMKLNKKTRYNSFRFDAENYLNPKEEFGKFVNHSCMPNSRVVKIKNKLLLVSLKKIKPKEEILIDYSTITAEDDWWKMKCNCGKKNCRSIIGKFSKLPKSLQKRYMKLKIVPDYIREIRAILE